MNVYDKLNYEFSKQLDIDTYMTHIKLLVETCNVIFSTEQLNTISKKMKVDEDIVSNELNIGLEF